LRTTWQHCHIGERIDDCMNQMLVKGVTVTQIEDDDVIERR
jgi:hypothetical protein